MKMKTFIGALLVGGTALGAGMLGLPVATGEGGIFPTWVIYVLSWLFSVATGLLFIEVGLWLPKNANIVSMATTLLGAFGKWFAWGLYLFLFYSLTVAYISGGGQLVWLFLGKQIVPTLGIAIFTFVFGLFVYLGTKIAGRVNAILMAGLVISYIGFVVLGAEHVDLSLIQHWGWKGAIFGLPVIFTSFSYQGVIPSLLEYLDRNVSQARKAIIFGTAIPFVAYLIWDIIVKGIVPVQGSNGLLAARILGISAIDPLRMFLESPIVAVIGDFFAFFALTTSFIGVTLGLLDFLVDSLRLEGNYKNKGWLALFVYIPPMIVTFINPNIFLQALGYAGGFGCALLLGLLPILMVFVGRYRKKFPQTPHRLPGGKITLGLLLLFVLFEISVQIAQQIF